MWWTRRAKATRSALQIIRRTQTALLEVGAVRTSRVARAPYGLIESAPTPTRAITQPRHPSRPHPRLAPCCAVSGWRIDRVLPNALVAAGLLDLVPLFSSACCWYCAATRQLCSSTGSIESGCLQTRRLRQEKSSFTTTGKHNKRKVRRWLCVLAAARGADPPSRCCRDQKVRLD